MAAVDEYQLEIQSIRRTLSRLKVDQAKPEVIEEYEAELRNLVALYDAARIAFDAAGDEPRLAAALDAVGYGPWTFHNVYSFVYDAAMETDTQGRDLANVINRTDYAKSLLMVLETQA